MCIVPAPRSRTPCGVRDAAPATQLGSPGRWTFGAFTREVQEAFEQARRGHELSPGPGAEPMSSRGPTRGNRSVEKRTCLRCLVRPGTGRGMDRRLYPCGRGGVGSVGPLIRRPRLLASSFLGDLRGHSLNHCWFDPDSAVTLREILLGVALGAGSAAACAVLTEAIRPLRITLLPARAGIQAEPHGGLRPSQGGVAGNRLGPEGFHDGACPSSLSS